MADEPCPTCTDLIECARCCGLDPEMALGRTRITGWLVVRPDVWKRLQEAAAARDEAKEA